MIAGKYHRAFFFQQFRFINNDLSAEDPGGQPNDDFENGVKHIAVMINNNCWSIKLLLRAKTQSRILFLTPALRLGFLQDHHKKGFSPGD